MNSLRDLFGNYVLNVAILCWLSAQLLKTLLNFLKTRRFNPERLVGAGGMPSAHSASVCRVINMIVRKNKNYVTYMPKDKDGLKEFLGHTPMEVMGGALLGILIAILLPM